MLRRRLRRSMATATERSATRSFAHHIRRRGLGLRANIGLRGARRAGADLPVALVVPVAEEANLADPRRVVKAAGPAAARVGLPTEGLMRAGVKGAVGLVVDLPEVADQREMARVGRVGQKALSSGRCNLMPTATASSTGRN